MNFKPQKIRILETKMGQGELQEMQLIRANRTCLYEDNNNNNNNNGLVSLIT